MNKILISQASIVNEGRIYVGDVLIQDGIISKVGSIAGYKGAEKIDACGKFLLPGIIDSHVHFREPGLTAKGDIYTESRAAVAGGITSYFEMPNTIPNVLSKEQLEEKYQIASQKSWANYAFYMGVCYKNIDSILSLPHDDFFCITDDGLYMSGENLMLSGSPETMERLFSEYKGLIAIHSEDEEIIHRNLLNFQQKYGDEIPLFAHPTIRNELACYLPTHRAIALAKKSDTRLHILHLTTTSELGLLETNKPISEKNVTAEVCIPHLLFCASDYERLSSKIKCNPAIKSNADQLHLLAALNDDRIDIISTDHAPHTGEEKERNYSRCPSGMPMVQHALPAMLELYLDSKITLEKVVEKMCHNPANLFRIKNRGFIREGYYADIVIVDINRPWTVTKESILYKCKWSPLEGFSFRSKVSHTFVNGNLVYLNGILRQFYAGVPIAFY